MELRGLTTEQIREVLARAEEIEASRLAKGGATLDIETIVSAAEEAGLSRESIMQALRERLGYTPGTHASGELVFAKSADGKFYAARVLELDEGIARVRFVNGGDQSVLRADLRSLSLVPGTRVVANWPFWGWYPGHVVSYEPELMKVTVSDGWSERRFDLSEVRIEDRQPIAKRLKDAPWAGALIFLSGGAIGSLLTWLLTR